MRQRKTSNQRARGRRRVLVLVLSLLLAAAIVLVIHLWRQIESMREQYGDRIYGPIVSLEMLPEDFDEAAYAAAQQRYNIEEGLLLPPAPGGQR